MRGGGSAGNGSSGSSSSQYASVAGRSDCWTPTTHQLEGADYGVQHARPGGYALCYASQECHQLYYVGCYAIV